VVLGLLSPRDLSMASDGSDEVLEHEVRTQPSGLGWLPDGDLLCVSMVDQKVLRFHDGEFSTFADVSEYCEFWANEMIVSPPATATSATSVSTSTRVSPNSALSVSAPNPTHDQSGRPRPRSTVIQSCPEWPFPTAPSSPRRRDIDRWRTFGRQLSAFDIGADGTLTNRRVWAPLGVMRSDGMCLDADGQIWFANPARRHCVRVREAVR